MCFVMLGDNGEGCLVAIVKFKIRNLVCSTRQDAKWKAPPLVTGTFGSADFMHSVLGEASE